MLLPIPRRPTPLSLRVLLTLILPVFRVPVPAFMPVVVDAGPGIHPDGLVAFGAGRFGLATLRGVCAVPRCVGVSCYGGE